MTTSITIKGSLTLDETHDLQNSGMPVPTPYEDNNDNDVALATLQTDAGTFYDRLFAGTGLGGLGLSTSFPEHVGVARSASDFISVSATGTVSSLGFVDGSGGTLPVYDPNYDWGADPAYGVATNLKELDDGLPSGTVYLYADPILGSQMVLGVDATGEIVLAIYMQPSADMTTATVWMVQFDALYNPDGTNPDDPVVLGDYLGVAASSSLEFDFSTLPSGQNLFGIVGDADYGLVVIGKDPVIKADGTYTNASNTINTSQGGGPTTIGVNNQMFDPTDGAYFTFVTQPNTNYLGTNLSATEADDADNILFGGTLEVMSAFTQIAQIQSNSTATMKVVAYDIANETGGSAFITNIDPPDSQMVYITAVRVFASGSATPLAEWNANADPAVGGVDVTFTVVGSARYAEISGLGAGYKVEWDTSVPHDRVLIEGVAGKFDIGAFGANEVSSTSVDIVDAIRFEDSGPIEALVLSGTTVTHDETAGVQTAADPNASNDVADLASLFTLVTNASSDMLGYAQSSGAVVVSPGSDIGEDHDYATTMYSLEVGATNDSGLTTTDGVKIFLFEVNDTLVVGRIGATSELAESGQAAFAVTIDADTGVVSLAQYASIYHANTSSYDEGRSIAEGALIARGTATDGDTDTGSATTDIGIAVFFQDDGPTAALAQTANTVTHDETAGVQTAGDPNPSNDMADLSGLFGGVGNVSTDLLGYAQSGGAVVSSAGSSYGQDEENGTTLYSLEVGASNDSGLDITDGTSIFLFKEGDLVVGRIGTTSELATTGQAAFAVAIDAGTGVVSVAQYASIYHANTSSYDESRSITDAALVAKVTVKDGDNDVATKTVNIGDAVFFQDDGPTAAIVETGTTVTHDETVGIDADADDTSDGTVAALFSTVSNRSTDMAPAGYAQSAGAVVDGSSSTYGQDEEGASRSYSLVVGADNYSGLTTTDGVKIYLFKVGDLVVGRIGVDSAAAETGEAAFAVAINATTGVVSLAQYASIHHLNALDADDVMAMTDASLYARVTVTDGDGDMDHKDVAIGDAIWFEDDGPTAAISRTGGTVTHDETAGLDADANDTDAAAVTAIFTGVSQTSTDLGTPGYAQSATGVVDGGGWSYGRDEEGGTRTFSLKVGADNDSGLDATDGTNIFLFKEGDLVVGRIGATSALAASGDAAFAVAIDAISGKLSVAQYASVYNPNGTDPDDMKAMSNTALFAVVTITDGDDDTANSEVAIGDAVRFQDDGPTAHITETGNAVTHDETAGIDADANDTDAAAVMALFSGVNNASTDLGTPGYAQSAAALVGSGSSVFGQDEENATKLYSLEVGANNDSGIDTTEGQNIFLFKEGDLVVGRIGLTSTVAATGQAAFAVAIDKDTGVVSVVQYASLYHPNAANPDDTVSMLDAALIAKVTVTDGDLDKHAHSVAIGDAIRFQDDGPDVTVNDASGTYDTGVQGTWSDLPGTDQFGALDVTLNSFAIAGGTPVAVNTALTKTGDYAFSGSITVDFTPSDGLDNPQTIDFALTFDPSNDTYDLQVDTPPVGVIFRDSSQGQLKAGGPDPVRTLLFGGSEAGADDVVFFGVVANAPKSGVAGGTPPNDLLDLIVAGDTDLTEEQIQAFVFPTNQIPTLISSSTQMNVSTAGIGINNNNLDGAGDGISAGDESFVFNPEEVVDKVNVYIDNSVGGYSPASGEELYYTVFFTDGTVLANQLVTTEMLQNALRGDPSVPKVAQGGKFFAIDGGDHRIDAIQLTMGDGTVKIPVIQWAIEQDFVPEDLQLNLTATLFDGDSDSATDTFSLTLTNDTII